MYFRIQEVSFFCMDTTSEVAFGCENMGLVENDINERVKLAVSELEMEILWTEIFLNCQAVRSRELPVVL